MTASPTSAEYSGASRLHYLVLGGVLAVGLALRLLQVERETLWTDEAMTLLIAHWPLKQLFLEPVDPTPGIYYALVKAFVPDGAGLAAIRAISVVFGVGAIAAIYAVGRLAIGRSAGLIAAAILALALPMIDYSQEGRPYSLLILLTLLSATGFLWWFVGLRAGRFKIAPLALFALATLLAFYTHFTAVFWIIPIIVAGRELSGRVGGTRAARAYLATMAVMAVAALPELWRTYLRGSTFGGFQWLENPDPLEFLAGVGDLVLPAGYWNGRNGMGTMWSTAMLVALLLLVGWRLVRHRSQWRTALTPEGAAVLVALLSVPVLVWLFGFAVTPIFMPRAILLCVPGFALLLALVATLERKPWIAPLFIALYAGSLAFTGTIRPREPWRPVADALAGPIARGEAVLVCPEWKSPPLRHSLGASARPNLYLMLYRHVMIIPSDLSGRGWATHYRSAIIEPILDRVMRTKEAGLDTRLASTPGTYWIVESECSADQRHLLRQWLGTGEETRVMDLPETPHHAAIRLAKFVAAPGIRPVLIPPELLARTGEPR